MYLVSFVSPSIISWIRSLPVSGISFTVYPSLFSRCRIPMTLCGVSRPPASPSASVSPVYWYRRIATFRPGPASSECCPAQGHTGDSLGTPRDRERHILPAVFFPVCRKGDRDYLCIELRPDHARGNLHCGEPLVIIVPRIVRPEHGDRLEERHVEIAKKIVDEVLFLSRHWGRRGRSARTPC